jgi:hypothetical protein
MCKQVNARGSNDRFIVVRGSGNVFKRSRGAFPRLRHESCVLAGAGAGATKQQAGHLKKKQQDEERAATPSGHIRRRCLCGPVDPSRRKAEHQASVPRYCSAGLPSYITVGDLGLPLKKNIASWAIANAGTIYRSMRVP